MKRKVNKVGPSTLTVSLPKKWIEQNHINKGDEIEMTLEPQSIIITANRTVKDSLKKAELTINQASLNFIRAILSTYYQQGFDLIAVRFDDASAFSLIQEAVSNLLGCEIIEKKDKSCTIKSYLGDQPEEFISVLNRMINLVKATQQTTLEDYKSGQHTNKDIVHKYRLSSWKFRDLCLRLLHKSSIKDEQAQEYFLIIWSLEKINRAYARFYKTMVELNSTPNPELIATFQQASDLFNTLAQLIYIRELGKIEQFNLSSEQLIEKLISIQSQLKKESPLAHHLVDGVIRMRDVSSSTILLP